MPPEIEFRTKPQIAIELLRRTLAGRHVQFDWVTADEFYGRNHQFLSALEGLGLRYLVEVPVDTIVWTVDPGSTEANTEHHAVQDCKSELGMADYEVRGWASWHHHMSLVGLAHLYVTLTQLQLGREVPELTLQMAVRLLKSVLPRPKLGPEEAWRVVQYHLHYGRIARESHHRSWRRRHGGVHLML